MPGLPLPEGHFAWASYGFCPQRATLSELPCGFLPLCPGFPRVCPQRATLPGLPLWVPSPEGHFAWASPLGAAPSGLICPGFPIVSVHRGPLCPGFPCEPCPQRATLPGLPLWVPSPEGHFARLQTSESYVYSRSPRCMY